MPEAVYHQMIMLRPMQAGISGFARVQGEAGRQLVQIHLRGVQSGMRAFWYAGDGLVKELGSSPANPRGEAGLYTDLPAGTAAPRRLTALLIADNSEKPRPLAIGLCTAQSAGSLMDARNALLALCERLEREKSLPAPAPAAGTAAAAKAERREAAAIPAGSARGGKADSPARAEAAAEASAAGLSAAAPEPGSSALPAERLCSGDAGQASAAPSGGGSEPAAVPRRRSCADQPPPREVFLPAIDVCRERRRRKPPNAPAEEAAVPRRECAASGQAGESHGKETGAVQPAAVSLTGGTVPDPGTGCMAPVGKEEGRPAGGTPLPPAPPLRGSSANPADRLPPLHWPEALRPLACCFDRCPPVPLMGWPGWRFVQVQKGQNGLWIGCERRAGSISRVAYVLPADAETPEGKPFRQARTAAGDPVQVLVTGG